MYMDFSNQEDLYPTVDGQHKMKSVVYLNFFVSLPCLNIFKKTLLVVFCHGFQFSYYGFCLCAS